MNESWEIAVRPAPPDVYASDPLPDTGRRARAHEGLKRTLDLDAARVCGRRMYVLFGWEVPPVVTRNDDDLGAYDVVRALSVLLVGSGQGQHVMAARADSNSALVFTMRQLAANAPKQSRVGVKVLTCEEATKWGKRHQTDPWLPMLSLCPRQPRLRAHTDSVAQKNLTRPGIACRLPLVTRGRYRASGRLRPPRPRLTKHLKPRCSKGALR